MVSGKILRSREEPPFALDLNLTSGQTFRWGHWINEQFLYGKPDTNGYWCTTTGNVVLCLREKDYCLEYIASAETIEFWNNKKIPVNDFVNRFLRRDYTPASLEHIFGSTPLTKELLGKYPGLVVLRQDPYETLLSFMLSPMNRVERIAYTVDRLAKVAGRCLNWNNANIHTVPTPDEILNADLTEVPLRFPRIQQKRLKEMAEFLMNNPSIFDDCKEMNYQDAWHTLQKIPGVGPKVADCVLLYSLDFLEAVPVDVHIFRKTAEMFPHLFKTKKKPNYKLMAEMWREAFQDFAGLVQLYVYIDARNSSIK